ncbi:unnamed protein product [Paramecium sonneborni]|uniref:Uncharacterized protein n=1 Tax=Paramecium sonneborni TaxID=65129 RepID=A0A8S1LKB8_9CILI|nr:unnamed protein product [Paramecium sonneborni]
MKQNKQNIHKVIRKRPWTDEEDLRVLELVQEFGPQKWTQIAQYLEGRIGKQCRERWHNHLNPSIKKTPWEEDEEWILFLYHKALSMNPYDRCRQQMGRNSQTCKRENRQFNQEPLEQWHEKENDRILNEVGLNQVEILKRWVSQEPQIRIFILNEFDPLQKKALEIILMNKQYKSITTESSESDDVSYPTKQSKKNQLHKDLIDFQREQQLKTLNDEMIEQNYISDHDQQISNSVNSFQLLTTSKKKSKCQYEENGIVDY